MDKAAVKIRTRSGLLATCMLFAAHGLADTEEPAALRHHEAHVHGEAVGNLTLDGPTLRLELEIPGVNLVGFEHPPRNQDQRAQLEAVLSSLRGAAWLALDARGRCELDAVNAHTHGFDEDDHHEYNHEGRTDDAHDHHRHDHDHHKHDQERGHDHRHDDHQHSDDHRHDHDHAEFHIVVLWACSAPERLRWVDLDLFADYPGNERIVIDVLTDRLARRFRLHASQTRMTLEP
jgi:hypothetical protein